MKWGHPTTEGADRLSADRNPKVRHNHWWERVAATGKGRTPEEHDSKVRLPARAVIGADKPSNR